MLKLAKSSLLMVVIAAMLLFFMALAAPTRGIDSDKAINEAQRKKEGVAAGDFGELSAMSPSVRLGHIVDQAVLAERDGRLEQAVALLKEAQSLAPALGAAGERTFLALRYRELAITAAEMDWRRVEHAFEDLRAVANRLPLWTEAQLERALSEAEIRLAAEPDAPGLKEANLRELMSEIDLIVQTIGPKLRPALLTRAREFEYALEDSFGALKRDDEMQKMR